MYRVTTVAYCGMTLPHGDYDTLEEAQDRVSKRLAYVGKLGCPVSRLDDNEWEIEEPEDCIMVPDFCGYLTITQLPED